MTLLQKRLATALLLSLIVAVGSHTLLKEHRERSSRAMDAADAAQLFACRKHGAPSGIVISSQGRTLTLEKRPGTAGATPPGWRLTSPIEAPADGAIVEGFVQTLCEQTSLGIIEAKAYEPPIDAALFHLMPPRHLVSLAFGNSLQQHLAVGDLSGFDNKLYVQRLPERDSNGAQASAPIEMTGDALGHHLQRETNNWREKRPLYFVEAPSVTEVSVAVTGGASFVLNKHNNDSFTVAAAHQGPVAADPQKAREWLRALLDARAEQFVADNPSDAQRNQFGFTKPRAVVSIAQIGRPSTTLILSTLKLGGHEHLFAQLQNPDGPILRLSSSALLDALKEGPKALHDMRVLHMAANEVQSILVQDGGRTLQWRRSTTTSAESPSWFCVAEKSQAAYPVDNDALNTALAQLIHMRAASIVTREATHKQLQDAALLAAKRTLTLLADNDRPLGILWLGRNHDGQICITDDKKQTIWSVFEGVTDRFISDAEPFKLLD